MTDVNHQVLPDLYLHRRRKVAFSNKQLRNSFFFRSVFLANVIYESLSTYHEVLCFKHGFREYVSEYSN